MSTTAPADTTAGMDADSDRAPEQEPAPQPPVGALMKRGEQVGRVVAHQLGVVFLRPVGGGTEWTAKPNELEPVSTSEELSPRVREANKRSRGEL
ncbi:hypothetical protein J7E99_34320 [Streptomyces sp. ISL-44]|uniref:hypothetical protein n=1 Tax=Streptomyces sp. ISL-44 TaxID=2819184 RepID=UPI001BE6631A|nr:hypothetical protein [Streptomyces sp. ISL-44]MBT2545628.1 hypothetical protein [Streptomyces sp. ISL-44]